MLAFEELLLRFKYDMHYLDDRLSDKDILLTTGATDLKTLSGNILMALDTIESKINNQEVH